MQTKVEKSFWVIIVCLGFSGACYLIQSSYNDWIESPITTTISTHPLENLDFPVVTVCPPEGLNTALNYDLMKLRNISLCEEDREELRKKVFEDMVEKPQTHYAQRSLDLIKYLDLRSIYDGHMSMPTPYGPYGLEVHVSNSQGSIQFGYRNEFDETFYKDHQEFHAVLQFPENLADQVGSGSLIIEIAADTQVVEGWEEYVEFGENDKYMVEHTLLKWQDAEANCQDKGGDLASVKSEGERQEIEQRVGVGEALGFYVGGTLDDDGTWHWRSQGEWCSVLIGEHFFWRNVPCSIARRKSICKLPSKQLTGNSTVKIIYDKNNLERITKLWVNYRYQKASESLQNSWQNKRRTGFNLTWRVENGPVMKAKVKRFGVIETPGYGKTFIESFYQHDHIFKAELEVSNDILKEVDDGSLIIELELDTRRHNGWQEEVTYWKGEKWFEFSEDDYRSWFDAEQHCKSKGGHLASGNSYAGRSEMAKSSEGLMPIWIGGKEGPGNETWTWIDGTPMIVSEWKYTYGDLPYCSLMYTGEYYKSNCFAEYPFLCQTNSIVQGNQTLRFEFKRANLTFSLFNVWHSYEYQNASELESWEEKRMTGFRLEWFVKDKNGTEKRENVSDYGWKQEASTPLWKTLNLKKVVAFTQKLKKDNKSVDDMIALVVDKKYEMGMSGMLKIAECKHGQMDASSLHTLSMELNINQNELVENEPTSSVDIETGLLVYSVMMFCPEDMRLWLFFQNLISKESPDFLLQATVSTIVSEKLNENIKNLAGEFYLDLQAFFNLELGKILLAVSSLSQIEDMFIQDLPFLLPHMEDIQQCLGGHDCNGVQHLIKSLGE